MEQSRSWTDARQSFLTDGFAHLPNLFRPEEVIDIRNTIHRHLKDQKAGITSGSFGKVEPLAALNIPTLRSYIADRRITDVVRGLLGTANPEFLLHCDAHWNDMGGWHKDTGDTVVADGYFGRPIYHYDECLVMKLAIYCEDHVDDDGGLHVKPGSHRSSSVVTGDELAIATRVGDVVAFDVRITHMGARQDALHNKMNTLNKRVNSLNKRAPSRVQQQFGRVLTFADKKINQRSDRTALFFSYAAKGVEDELTQMFARTNWERGCRQTRRSFDVPDNLIEDFSRLDIHVMSI
jgi:hypothetical protein